jgi:hypothetical protein
VARHVRWAAYLALDFFGSFCACLRVAASAKARSRQKERKQMFEEHRKVQVSLKRFFQK